MTRAASPRTVELDWLGNRVRVVCRGDTVADMIDRLWGNQSAAEATDDRPRRNFEIRADGTEGHVFRDSGDGTSITLDPRCPEFHAYNLFVTHLLAMAGQHFVYHATAVARGDQALLLSGPSTFGKSTLGLHLACRGFGLLADDVVAQVRTDRNVLAFHRPLRLRPGARETLRPSDARRAREACIGKEIDDWFVDPARWPGVAEGPCNLAMIVLIRPGADGTEPRRFPYYEIRVLQPKAEILEDLTSLEGVDRVVIDPSDSALATIEVRAVSAFLSWQRENQESIVYAAKFASAPPSFDGSPELVPISRFQAAVELCQEMQNRHPGSLIEREFRDREPLLVMEVAALLGDARCFALIPGDLEETMGLLTSTFEDSRS